MDTQWRHRSGWASTQSDQSLRWWHELNIVPRDIRNYRNWYNKAPKPSPEQRKGKRVYTHVHVSSHIQRKAPHNKKVKVSQSLVEALNTSRLIAIDMKLFVRNDRTKTHELIALKHIHSIKNIIYIMAVNETNSDENKLFSSFCSHINWDTILIRRRPSFRYM